MLRLIIFAVLLVLAVSHAQELDTKVPLEDCGSPSAYLTKLEIYPPCSKDSCYVQAGERITLAADMVPKINTNKLFVTGYNKDLYWGFETYLWKENLCSSRFNVTCPLEAGKVVNVVFNEIAPSNLPPGKFRLKMIVSGDDDKRMLCKSAVVEFKSASKRYYIHG